MRGDALRHIAGRFFAKETPARLGVAVSGGSDSMALLDLMIGASRDLGFEVQAVTVDHGLRAGSREEAKAVTAFCEARGVSHDILAWSGWDGRGNLQAGARKARYALIAEWAKRRGVDWVALGHTEDDQAETVVMRIARAAGVDGLAGMPERFSRNGLVMIRPLIGVGREALRAHLRAENVAWSEDPSNEDESYERVRARRALAVLRDLGIEAGTLASVAGHARSVKSALDHYAWREAVENGLAVEDRGDLILRASGKGVHNEVTRRLRNAALMWIGGGEYPPRAASLAELESALTCTERHTLAGALVSRERRDPGGFRFAREFDAVKDVVAPTDALWDGRWVLEGVHREGLEARALGDAVSQTPWRETGMPRASLMASPAIWRGDELVAAPVAGLENGWTASATGRGTFSEFLLSR